MTADPRHLLLHAASLARSNAGVIFTGESGAGKSTLAAALVARGWSYGCDEFAMIDPNTLSLQAFPKALCIKAGSFDIIKQLNLRLSKDRYYVKAFKGCVGYISPSEIGGLTIATPNPVRFIFFPQYTGRPQPNLYSLPRTKALFMLAENTLNRRLLKDRTIPILQDVVHGARCFKLECGDINATCDAIESLVDNP